MAEVNEKVMKMVEAEIKKNPKVTSAELQAKGAKLDAAIGQLSPRQFNARYPLQVKRQNAPRRPRGEAAPRRRRRAEAVDRGAIRGVLLQFAKDVSSADDAAELVDIIGGVDKYVDRVVKAAGAA